ncbi:MAG TPA: hypothetical protein VGV15_01455 [Terriglobales bacterium]|nr:hypothetical protein [Terriglobales bacterium]
MIKAPPLEVHRAGFPQKAAAEFLTPVEAYTNGTVSNGMFQAKA